MVRIILRIIGIIVGVAIACFSIVYGLETCHAFNDDGNTFMLAVSISWTIIGILAGAILTALCCEELLFD